MSKRVDILRVLVSERLTAAAEEIFALVERTIVEYEEELCRSKEENQRHTRESGPDVEPKTTTPPTKVFESILDQENSVIHETKFEQEEMYIKQEEEELVVIQVSDDEEEKSVPVDLRDKDWSKPLESTASSSTHSETGVVIVSKNPPKPKKYVCEECGKQEIPPKSHLVTHMVTHTGEKPFSCSECDARFSQKQNLVRHMTIHSGERSYTCPVCGKSFSHKHSVQLHMLTHTGEKPFSCSLCDSRFTKKPHLNRHVKCCHNGEKPYSCLVCHRSFTQKFDVQRHMKRLKPEPRDTSRSGDDSLKIKTKTQGKQEANRRQEHTFTDGLKEKEEEDQPLTRKLQLTEERSKYF
ncbi:hypothetical protein WMY93_024762 [Mugilogobius chulae]|uniref:C2H2-type domain-containing protein n=1 Tax=Mugilogobius chulae TaxID=88201 RepID=A0AAW0N4Z9_9GOBI